VNPEHAEACSFCAAPLRKDDRCPECNEVYPEHAPSCSFSEEIVSQEGICPECGASNPDHPDRCEFCDASLRTAAESLQEEEEKEDEPEEEAAEAEPATLSASSAEPEWRLEVSRKLEEYRARRGQSPPVEGQEALPFLAEIRGAAAEPARDAAAPRGTRRRTERVEISIFQPQLDFTGGQSDSARPDTDLVPVAELGLRFRAALLDAVFLALSFAGFLGLFRLLGGHLAFNRVDAAVYALAFLLFYIQYFVLFTAFGGITPGMQLAGLSVVSFDGSAPTLRQLMWRSFGYIVAGGSALLGFVWALWDEDHLSWQDRISQTYITSAPPAALREPEETAPEPQSLTEKSLSDQRRIG
jgi:uncharacterized RDD family membrane protein YckC